MKRHTAPLLFCAFTILAACGLTFMLRETGNEDTSNCSKPFDSELWKKSHEEHDNPRHLLLSTLKQCYLKIGITTREEVHGLLGEPDGSNIYNDSYWLGTAPFGIDGDSYILQYDDNGILVKYYLRRG